jgi:hypothetical protein
MNQCDLQRLYAKIEIISLWMFVCKKNRRVFKPIILCFTGKYFVVYDGLRR